MCSYAEGKVILDGIREKYGCKGEILFRSAMQCVMEHGQHNFTDAEWFESVLNEVNERHDRAEANGKILFMTRDFEVALLECAREIARVNSYNLLIYVQREVWLSNEGIDYQRVVELLKKCMGCIEEDYYDNTEEVLKTFEYLGFTDEELVQLGYCYLIKE